MRVYGWYVPNVMLWALNSVLWSSYSISILGVLELLLASASIALGSSYGVATFRRIIKNVEKNGEYRGSWIPWAIAIFTGLALVGLSASGVLSIPGPALVSGVALVLFAESLSIVVFSQRWETKSQKELHYHGVFLARWYTVPKRTL